MQARCKMIFDIIEGLAPLDLAEEWDNCGLQVGDPERVVSGVLLSLDMDEDICQEAVDKGANLVITHHPLFFRGIKQIREDRPPGRLVSRIIKSGLTVYAAHTNLDSAGRGVSSVLADRMGLSDTAVLRPGSERFLKLAVFVPVESADKVREALAGAGAGWIGKYSDCAFMVEGTGTFRPLEGSNPYMGRTGSLERVAEVRLETIIPARLAGNAVRAMLWAHPYEEVAYDLYPLENRSANSGLGRVGELKTPVSLPEFAGLVKERINVSSIRYGGPPGKEIKRVAVCGGSGGDLWQQALGSGADVLVTGDIGYHAARDMLAAGLSFIDAGHYGTERVVLEPLADYLRKSCRERGLSPDIFISSRNGDPFIHV